MKYITLAILVFIGFHSCTKPTAYYDLCSEPQMELSLNNDGFIKIYKKNYRDSIPIFPDNKKSKVFHGILGNWKGGKIKGDTITIIISARNKRKFIIGNNCLMELNQQGEL
jgi:hypothetical protein